MLSLQSLYERDIAANMPVTGSTLQERYLVDVAFSCGGSEWVLALHPSFFCQLVQQPILSEC